jgi:hypothetical protein
MGYTHGRMDAKIAKRHKLEGGETLWLHIFPWFRHSFGSEVWTEFIWMGCKGPFPSSQLQSSLCLMQLKSISLQNMGMTSD